VEPLGGAHTDPAAVFERVGVAVVSALDELCGVDPDELVASRYARLRSIGVYGEE
jgi:acetyl-CoA carboxylase carboxyl transferase subunit alpha